ncbi:MAG: ABC transporter permease [Thaumarchaeota archaeon]|nr:ABC transporter permease [Nitrososphaerota archaeon]
MNLFEVLSLASNALGERKLRSALTILMVVVGAGLITALNGMNSGFDSFINEQLSALSPNVLIVSPSQSLSSFGPSQGGGSSFLGSSSEIVINDRTVRTLEGVRGVDEIVPTVRGSVQLVSRGRVTSSTVTGMDQSKLFTVNPGLELAEGGVVSAGDVSGILLGWGIAHPEGQSEAFARVGDTLVVQRVVTKDVGERQVTETVRRSFAVRGVLENTGNLVTDASAYITLRAAASFLDKSGKYDSLFVVASSIEASSGVEKGIREIYGQRIGITTPQAIQQTINTVVGGITLFLFSIGSVSLLVGAIGIVTTMYTSVMERIREVGLLKALGATKRMILLMFLSEAMIIGLLGGLFGTAAGAIGASVLLSIFRFGPPGAPTFSPVFTAPAIASVLLLSVVLSMLAGTYPAWRASRLPPIVALRRD